MNVSIKNIKQNIQKNIVQCSFYETRIRTLRLIGKTPPNIFTNSTSNFHCWFLKTNTVIYYYNLGA